MEEIPEIDCPAEPLALQSGDRILLCSDGLYRSLDDDELISILKRDSSHAADNLVDCAIRKDIRHQDNITCLTMAVEGHKAKTNISFLRYAAVVLFVAVVGLFVYWRYEVSRPSHDGKQNILQTDSAKQRNKTDSAKSSDSTGSKPRASNTAHSTPKQQVTPK